MGRIKQLGQVRVSSDHISLQRLLSFRLQPPPQKRDRHFESASVGIRIDSLRGFWPVILRHPAVSLPEPAIELEGEPGFTKAGFRLYHHNLGIGSLTLAARAQRVLSISSSETRPQNFSVDGIRFLPRFTTVADTEGRNFTHTEHRTAV